MYPKPSLPGAQGNLCRVRVGAWDTPRSPAPRSLPTPPGHGSRSPFPASPEGSEGLWGFIFCAADLGENQGGACARGSWEGKESQCTGCSFSLKGRDSSSPHGDTSLLTPPICILTPLGNSGGQTKRVGFGLGRKKPNQRSCVFQWKQHHALTATLTCLCLTSHRNVGQSVFKKENPTTQLLGKVLDLFFLS